MPGTKIDSKLIEATTRFHGHWCPGLAIGIRAAELALEEVGRADDEDIVAIVETDMCAVDAIQYLVGCTFGKGNLIYRDYGKNAFTFHRRRDGKAVRIITRPAIFGDAGETLGKLHKKLLTEGLSQEEEQQWQQTRAQVSKRVMESSLPELFEIKPAQEPAPPQARILASLICEACGESTMETRTRRVHDQVLCIPCCEAREMPQE
jgi:formylmethanofuran dehydrogenase subunit E